MKDWFSIEHAKFHWNGLSQQMDKQDMVKVDPSQDE